MFSDPETFMVAKLSACLSLVRPVGMTAQETEDWLEVALDTLQHLPAHIFAKGELLARQKCTHHSQIVPTIIIETREDLEWHNRPKGTPPLRLVSPAHAAQPIPKPELPDPNYLSASLQAIGLSAGWLIKRDGQVEWTEEDNGNDSSTQGLAQ